MSFHVISSNDMHRLVACMGQLLQDNPLPPMQAETIMVSGVPTQRWLELKLADVMGVHCHVDYPLPASWLWRLISAQSDATDALSREPASWLVFKILPDLLHSPAFAPLAKYLRGDESGVKRWQLADRIADTFDRYQYYRPDTIRNWSAGGGDDWQAHLWRALLEQVGKGHHRVAMMDAWLKQAGKPIQPERIHMFCISSLPPLLLQLLQKVSEHTTIYFYHLSPTKEYWADLLPKKAVARKRLEHPDEEIYAQLGGHELLTSWGRQGQVFQDLLLKHDGLEVMEYDLYDEDFKDTVLGRLQQDVFFTAVQGEDDADPTEDEAEPLPDTESLSIHVCHSPLRECHVLHDELLKAFEADPKLMPEDVRVMVPDIQAYAPYIKAVFERDSGVGQAARPHIPYHISDVSVASEQALVQTFLKLLALPGSRFTRSEVESMLDIPEVCSHMGLDAEGVATVRHLLADLNVRWGLDGEHRRDLGLPAQDMHTWKQARQRFFTAYAMSHKVTLWRGMAPVELSMQQAAAMAHFWRMVERMDIWRKKLVQSRSARDWEIDLNAMLLDFFGEQEADELQVIRDALAALAEKAGDDVLSHDLLQYCLQQKLDTSEVSNRYFSGGVSFCGMRPLRSVPFKMIALLGMDDVAYPRREHALEFDRMAEHWQPGDPSKSEQDRYLMLETLLCAQERLYISYVGRSVRDNTACQPSVLVSELLDELYRIYGESAVNDALVYEHPMQAFSADIFKRAESYDRDAYALAKALQQDERVAGKAWGEPPLPEAVEQTDSIPLNRLIQFVKHPVRYFVNHRLNIYLSQDEELCDDEPFTLNHLEAWTLKARLLGAALQQKDVAVLCERMQAEGLLPHGVAGKAALQAQIRQIQSVVDALEDYQGKKTQVQAVDMDAGGMRIHGQIRHYIPGMGLLHSTPSKLKGKYVLACWLEHLVLCCAGILQDKECSRLQCSDRAYVFKAMDAGEAGEHLQTYVDAYVEGMRQPLPVFERASFAQVFSDKGVESRVRTAWQGNSLGNIAGDAGDAYVQLLMRGVEEEPVALDEFKRWAEAFYAPIRDFGVKA